MHWLSGLFPIGIGSVALGRITDRELERSMGAVTKGGYVLFR